MKLEDLETRLDGLKNLRNDFVVKDGDKEVFYIGEAKRLYFDGLTIRGQPGLSRVDRTKGTKSKLKVVSWFPPKLARKEVPFVKDKKVWGFIPEYNHDFFIYQGYPQTYNEYSGHAGYRKKLVGLAANQGIILTRELLDLVFRPIDEELMRIYRKVARKE